MNAAALPILEVIKVQIVSPIMKLLIGAAFMAFLYGVFEFIQADDKTRDAGKRHIMWGIVGLFIMVSAFGLTNFIIASLPVTR